MSKKIVRATLYNYPVSYTMGTSSFVGVKRHWPPTPILAPRLKKE